MFKDKIRYYKMPLINSKIERKILQLFFTNPENSFYVRQLARQIEEDPTNLSRKLKKMSLEGILDFNQRGKEKYYYINKQYPLYQEYKKIIFKTIGIKGNLQEILKEIKGIEYAFIFGSYAKDKETNVSDIDLFIIGNPDEDLLIKEINKLEKELQREINYHIFSLVDINSRIKSKDSFIQNIIFGPKVFLIGNQNEFSKLN